MSVVPDDAQGAVLCFDERQTIVSSKFPAPVFTRLHRGSKWLVSFRHAQRNLRALERLTGLRQLSFQRSYGQIPHVAGETNGVRNHFSQSFERERHWALIDFDGLIFVIWVDVIENLQDATVRPGSCDHRLLRLRQDG